MSFCLLPSSSNQSRWLPEVLLLLLLLLLLVSTGVTSKELKNADFESPPSNLPENPNKTSVTLSKNNTIPGWTFQGTVEYITVVDQMKNKGHAILLGKDGKINQSIGYDGDGDYLRYFLTFAFGPGGQNCSPTAPLQMSMYSDEVFSFSQLYGKEPWEVHGVYLANLEPGDLVIDIEFEVQSQPNDSTPTCWPAIDSLRIKTMPDELKPDKAATSNRVLAVIRDSLVDNGGFEYGPDFLESSDGGVLLDSTTTRFTPIYWQILGKVRYINSKHFFVPQGNAAIELVSGVSSGVQTLPNLVSNYNSYTLYFTMGDANNSCKATFLVGVQAGQTSQNFTLESNGTGSAVKFSMTFNVAPANNIISFRSYTTSHTKDGYLCGPVIDDVFLSVSYGLRKDFWKSLIHLCLIAVICFL